jgi:thiamine pyrophosphate-dependent acetolactate synthase large subunit-like protein
VHGGDRVARVLERRGVRFVFTLCGGHVSPILTGAKALGLRIVDVRHEATAVFAADAVARLTGLPGVAVVTAGPGVTNTITAIKNAALAQAPLVLIGGAAPTALKGRGALQDIDQKPLVAPHVKSFRAVRRVRDLAPAIDEAFDIAAAGVPGPAFVECPVDLLYDEATIREWYRAASGKGKSLADRALAWYLRRHADRLFAPGPEHVAGSGTPAVAEAPHGAVTATIEALSKSQRPLLVIGSQALACPSEANEIAQAVSRLGIPAYLSGMARGLLGRESPLQLRHRRREALREADCVILAGVPCDFRLDYGRHIRRGAKLIAANRSAYDARLNRGPDIIAVGDAGRFLRALAGSSPPPSHGEWLSTLRARDLEREAQIAKDASVSGERLNPIALCRTLEDRAATNATFVADGGDFVATASYTVHPRAPLTWLDPGVFGTLGVGAGFALGAKLCRPQDEIWVLWGDGAFGYGLAEYDTFVRHRVGVIGVVGNDASWSQIAREQVKLLGDDVSTVLARSNYHQAVEGLGGAGFLARRDDELRAAIDNARAAALQGQPALVNAWLDASAFREGSISM